MNRNDYRRALLMLRSLKTGVSGYVRLERRTLMGTLQFTVNGAPVGTDLYAILLHRTNGGWNAVRLAEFGTPRYGQTGLVWKFDPRNIENRTLEQYELAAVVEIRNNICDLLLCGNLNGSVEVDWAQIRSAACRLFSAVRISGVPIPPIDEPKSNDLPQTLPDFSGDPEAYPGEMSCNATVFEKASDAFICSGESERPLPDSETAPADSIPDDSPARPLTADPAATAFFGTDFSSDDSAPDEKHAEQAPPSLSVESSSTPVDQEEPLAKSTGQSTTTETSVSSDAFDTPAETLIAPDEFDVSARASAMPDRFDIPADASFEPDELDMPAEDIIEPDEFDAPADESHLMQIASPSLIASQILPSSADESSVEPDEFDSPAQNPCKKHTPSAGEQLALSNPDAEWPEAIEPLRKLFFTSEAIIPFAAPEYVFIRAPLTEESGMNSCLCGICCESGIPARVCYAIPAPYTAEPPAGMEGYIWRGDHLRGYWTICENLTSSDGTLSS